MMKFLFIGRRAAGTTRAAALRHLRDVHGRMVVLPPADAGPMPSDYVQNHVFDGAYPPTGGAYGIERDLVTLFWFEDLEALRASTTTPYYLANLAPDEPRFVDRDSVAKLRVVPHTRLEPGADCPFKLFLVLSRRSDVATHRWLDGLAALADGLRVLRGFAGLVDNAVAAGPPGEPPFADNVFEAWFDTRVGAAQAADRFDNLLNVLGRDMADPSRCFALAAEEYPTSRLLAVYRGDRT